MTFLLVLFIGILIGLAIAPSDKEIEASNAKRAANSVRKMFSGSKE